MGACQKRGTPEGGRQKIKGSLSGSATIKVRRHKKADRIEDDKKKKGNIQKLRGGVKREIRGRGSIGKKE